MSASHRYRLARFSFRLLRRDLGSGHLLVMLLATIIAVTSTVSINLLVNRVKGVMIAESSALLAGDLALVTPDRPPLRYLSQAMELGLSTSRTVTLRSVVAFGEQLQLVRLKAVDGEYPLRGDLQVADAPLQPSMHTTTGPERGEIWADARLFQLLEIQVGDALTIGSSRFNVARLLVLEPDRGGDLFAFAPRVMMHYDDLAATGLIVPGSRASYTTLLAGTPDDLRRFQSALALAPGHSLLDPRASRPEMENAFVQAERFLTLAAFVGVLLATIGIALAAGAYSDQHQNTVAIFKTLGLATHEVSFVLTIEVLLLALLATAVGDVIAIAVHEVLISQYVPDLDLSASAIPWMPLAHGGWVAGVVLVGFALPTLVHLTRLPVNAILMRDRTGIAPRSRYAIAIMLGATVLIAPWHLGAPALVGIALGGMLGSAAVVALAAYALVRLLSRLRGRTTFGWRFGLANIARRARLSVLQSTALGLGIAVILLLGLVRNDLLEQWRDRLPADAPNHFLINIQADEVDALRAFLEPHVTHAVRFYPMVRGRLVAVNGAAVDAEAYSEPRAQRLAAREFNLSWAAELKSDNRVTAGKWWTSAAQGQLSIEQGIAETLGIALHDRVDFSVGGRTISGNISSIRHVDWDNFEVNFFVVTTPELLIDAPATYITSFYLDPAARNLMPNLVKGFPSVTVIDVDALMQQVRSVMDRVSGALTWVFTFALLAGVMVLAAAVQANQHERVLDVVLLKTLGAPRRFITMTVLLEFALLGALAGVIGSAGATATGWLLAEHVLNVPYHPDWRVALVGLSAGVIGVTLLGTIVVSQTHRRSVVSSLRLAE